MTPRTGAAVGGLVGTAVGLVGGIAAASAVRGADTKGWVMLGGIVLGSIGGAVIAAGKTPGSTGGFFSGTPAPSGARLPPRPALG